MLTSHHIITSTETFFLTSGSIAYLVLTKELHQPTKTYISGEDTNTEIFKRPQENDKGEMKAQFSFHGKSQTNLPIENSVPASLSEVSLKMMIDAMPLTHIFLFQIKLISNKKISIIYQIYQEVGFKKRDNDLELG